MSLNFNLEKIANFEKVCLNEDGEIGARTRTLLLSTMSIGIPDITKKNVDEVFLRLCMLERVYGVAVHRTDDEGNRVDIPITREVVEKHIGLSTNADTLSETAFNKRIAQSLRQRIKREVG